MNRKTAKLSYSLMLAGAMALAAPQAMAAGMTAPQSQSHTTGINGQVLDEFGDPITGASVLVEGTTTGTVTDFDGNFEIPQAADQLRWLHNPAHRSHSHTHDHQAGTRHRNP